MSRSAIATIHLDALRHNLQKIRDLAPHSRVMAVVKADGYGHGLERVARALAAADAFGVAAIADGQRLRAAGVEHRIVVLSGIDEHGDLAEVRRLGLDVVLHHHEQLRLMESDRDPRPVRVWLKIDTGMHRLGIAQEQAAAVLARLRALPQFATDVVLMSHFSSSDEFSNDKTPRQAQRFDQVFSTDPGAQSLANSAAILGFPATQRDWVRAGGLIYGLAVVADKNGADFGFRPAMTLSSKLIAINRVGKGEFVGYGERWQCPEDMNIGVVAMGYGDGYPRAAPCGTAVLVNGRVAPIVGRVSMDLMCLDLRTHADARINDRVVLWGAELPVEGLAKAADTISYELTCGVTRRVMFLEDDAGVSR